MYPWLHLGPLTISTYSLMFLCAFIVGGIITYYEVRRQHCAPEATLRVAPFTGRLFEKRASQETDQSAKMKDRKKTSSKGERSCLNGPHYPNGKKRCQAICRA